MVDKGAQFFHEGRVWIASGKKRNPKTKVAAIVDEFGGFHPESECQPVEPFTEHDLATAKDIVTAILNGEESIDWLSGLAKEQKGQLWQALTAAEKAGLTQLARAAA